MNHIHLYGPMAETYPRTLKLEVLDAGEAVRAMSTQLHGFGDVVAGGEFILIRSTKGANERLTPEELEAALADEDTQIGEDALRLGLGASDLHFVQIIGGSGGRGLGKVLLGVALIAGAFISGGADLAAVGASYGSIGGMSAAMGATAFSIGGLSVSVGQIAIFGAAMALGGISQLLTKSPKGNAAQNYDIGPPANVTNQGVAVPLIYGGPIRVGTIVVSSEVNTNKVVSNGGVVQSGYYGTISGTITNQQEGVTFTDTSYADPNLKNPLYIGSGDPGNF